MPVSSELRRILGEASYRQSVQGSLAAYESAPVYTRSRVRQTRALGETREEKETRLLQEESIKLRKEVIGARHKEEVEARKSARDFRLDLYKEAFKQRGRLETKELNLLHKKEFEGFKYDLTAEERFRKARNDRVLNDLRRARIGEITTKPQMKKFESDLRRIEEGEKAKDRFALENFRQEGSINIERFRQAQNIKLKAITEGLLRTRPKVWKPEKPPKESTSQQFQRMMKAGAFETVRDIARLGAEQKFKGNALREITELRASQMGIPMPLETSWGSARKLTDIEWTEWLGTKLPVPDIDNANAGMRRALSFGSKEAAEKALLQLEYSVREQGLDEDVIQNDIMRMRQDIESAYTGVPSNYESLKSNDDRFRQIQEAQRPDITQATGNISNNIKTIYDDILTGLDGKSNEGLNALKQIQSLIGDIQKTEGDRVSEEERRSRLRQQLGYSPKQEQGNAAVEKENAAEAFWNTQRQKLESIETEEEFEGFKKEFLEKRKKKRSKSNKDNKK